MMNGPTDVTRDEHREEYILYPTVDRLLRPAERAALVARLQREAVR